MRPRKGPWKGRWQVERRLLVATSNPRPHNPPLARALPLFGRREPKTIIFALETSGTQKSRGGFRIFNFVQLPQAPGVSRRVQVVPSTFSGRWPPPWPDRVRAGAGVSSRTISSYAQGHLQDASAMDEGDFDRPVGTRDERWWGGWRRREAFAGQVGREACAAERGCKERGHGAAERGCEERRHGGMRVSGGVCSPA